MFAESWCIALQRILNLRIGITRKWLQLLRGCKVGDLFAEDVVTCTFQIFSAAQRFPFRSCFPAVGQRGVNASLAPASSRVCLSVPAQLDVKLSPWQEATLAERLEFASQAL